MIFGKPYFVVAHLERCRSDGDRKRRDEPRAAPVRLSDPAQASRRSETTLFRMLL
jgi:hypothetical protein